MRMPASEQNEDRSKVGAYVLATEVLHPHRLTDTQRNATQLSDRSPFVTCELAKHAAAFANRAQDVTQRTSRFAFARGTLMLRWIVAVPIRRLTTAPRKSIERSVRAK